MNRREFYEEIGRVPEVPAYMYGGVRGRVRHRRIVGRSVLALAATLVLAVGTSGVFMATHRGDKGVSVEVADELQTVHGYLCGEDLDQESQVYALNVDDAR